MRSRYKATQKKSVTTLQSYTSRRLPDDRNACSGTRLCLTEIMSNEIYETPSGRERLLAYEYLLPDKYLPNESVIAYEEQYLRLCVQCQQKTSHNHHHADQRSIQPSIHVLGISDAPL